MGSLWITTHENTLLVLENGHQIHDILANLLENGSVLGHFFYVLGLDFITQHDVRVIPPVIIRLSELGRQLAALGMPLKVHVGLGQRAAPHVVSKPAIRLCIQSDKHILNDLEGHVTNVIFVTHENVLGHHLKVGLPLVPICFVIQEELLEPPGKPFSPSDFREIPFQLCGDTGATAFGRHSVEALSVDDKWMC